MNLKTSSKNYMRSTSVTECSSVRMTVTFKASRQLYTGLYNTLMILISKRAVTNSLFKYVKDQSMKAVTVDADIK